MKKAYFKYILALLLFGSNGIIASHISLTSYEIVLLRTLIGSLLLIALFIVMGQKFSFHEKKRHLFYLSISGAAMGASWLFLYEAYKQIGVSVSTLAYYCGPVIVMAISPFLFREKLTKVKVYGFISVLCGLFLVNIQAFQEGKMGWGLFCGGMSAVMYAAMVVLNKKADRITGIENSMIQLWMSFLTVAIYVGIKQGFAIHISNEEWIPILILGVLNTGLGCFLYFSSIGILPVQTVAITGYLEPLSAVCFSAVFLGEILQPVQVIGAALILGGAMYGESVFGLKGKRQSI